MKRPTVFAVYALVWACSRSQSDADVHDGAPALSPGPSSVASATRMAALNTHGTDAAPLGSSATTATGGKERWRGSYKSTSGELYIPSDWKNVRWNVKESPAGVGEGAIVLSVDSSSGRVLGSLEGPLGPAIIDGLVSEATVTATVTRKDPADKGFIGTLVGSIKGDHAEGTMSLSLAEASAVRHASFALSREGQAAAP